ncbi:fungal-specific transcription factor domain-containing protein [Mycena alexandri]|uniref:Fungal-specific transcription factor domain-containing protein n=1 Tax=Mycena alexandri TaxID=1745969 RepID=A0AAD6S4X4_9AGAR|nr:fungal-specific transcription factor domain-containing protein [Mycena alexandri]
MEPPPSTGLLYIHLPDANSESGPGFQIPAGAPGSKRRRLRGACDICKARKIRCDSAKMPGNVCSNCVTFNSHCTHQGLAKSNSGSKKSSPGLGFSSAEDLDPDAYNGKTASEHVGAILIQSTAYIADRDLRNILLDVARYSRKLELELKDYKRSASVDSNPPPSGNMDSSRNGAVVDSSPDGILVLCDELQGLAMFNATGSRFFGRSSSFYLLQTAQQFKEDHDGPNVRQPDPIRRTQFWFSPWELSPSPPAPVYHFPPDDLLNSLVATYFNRINIIMALLHRPTFERSIASGLHLLDNSFGSVVLAVCALASRYSDDPRVVLEGTNSRLSAGWEWFRQIQYPGRDFYLARTLYDVQRLFLSVAYLQGTCSQEACWVLVAIGIRNMQDIGTHMQKRRVTPWGSNPNTKPVIRTIEEELYLRVFWLLICSDAVISAFLGRPRVTRDDDYDIDYPVECDDEYWDHPDPNQKFQQPEGKPSIYAFSVAYMKLTEILGTAQKTIYSVKRSQRGTEWGQTAVVDLDSALNGWLDAIPDHLRWDPNREDETFATQSACLYTAYYHVQIQIHRSFIPSPTNDAPLSSTFPSLAICANSARSCSRVMESQAAKRGVIAHPQVVSALMDSAVFLLLNVWGARRSGVSADPQRAAIDVQKCVRVLKMYEVSWQVAGRYCDTLFTIGNQLISNPPAASARTRKRTRSAEAQAITVSPPAAPQHSRHIAGSTQVTAIQDRENSGVPMADFHRMPISTEELGDLPVYQSFDWGLPFGSDLSVSGLSFKPDANDGKLPSRISSGNPLKNPDPHCKWLAADDWATRDWTDHIDEFDPVIDMWSG